MTKQEILDWLDSEVEGYPQRATGNECEDFVVKLAGRIVSSDRSNLVEAMRQWILDRGRRTLLGVRIAKTYKLYELKPDIQQLLEDVRARKAFLPYYEEFIAPALRQLDTIG
jgi:hypothetical protein